MKRFSLVFLIVVFILLGFGGFIWWNSAIKPVSTTKESKSFVIAKGSGTTQIANKLQKEGLIKSALAFRFYVQLTGRQNKVQAGEYDLSPSVSLIEIVDELTKGPRELWVAIPEGLRREEVADKFASGLQKSPQDKTIFTTQFLTLSQGKEGMLFPDTYLFPKTASASAVVSSMTNTFDKRFDSKLRTDMESQGLTLNQVLTLASILERETVTDEERPMVADILVKRWKADWPLQADATVQYAMANVRCKNPASCESWWPRPITAADLEITSPYNTYKFPGLPPAPIASPGLSSIKAVIYRQVNAYWFYLHDSKGEIRYAETLEEHNANVRKYLGK